MPRQFEVNFLGRKKGQRGARQHHTETVTVPDNCIESVPEAIYNLLLKLGYEYIKVGLYVEVKNE